MIEEGTLHNISLVVVGKTILTERSQVTLRFAFVSISILQQPRGQAQLTEVNIALIEPLNTVGLVVDVVSDIFQVLQVRPLQSRSTQN